MGTPDLADVHEHGWPHSFANVWLFIGMVTNGHLAGRELMKFKRDVMRAQFMPTKQHKHAWKWNSVCLRCGLLDHVEAAK